MIQSTIQVKIHQAHTLFDRYGEAMRNDEAVRTALERFSAAIRRTADGMAAERIGEACAACAERYGGGCCFQGMEEGFDETLLLINLLMGCEIPRVSDQPGGCLFVGSRGCRLQAKYHFCLNYFCHDLTQRLGGPPMTHLLAVVGEELKAGLEAENAVKRRLGELEAGGRE